MSKRKQNLRVFLVSYISFRRWNAKLDESYFSFLHAFRAVDICWPLCEYQAVDELCVLNCTTQSLDYLDILRTDNKHQTKFKDNSQLQIQ